MINFGGIVFDTAPLGITLWTYSMLFALGGNLWHQVCFSALYLFWSDFTQVIFS
jgi:hypothetical protein